MSTKQTSGKINKSQINGHLRVIGIAGGIGSGKSTVTDYLEQKNYHVYDADVEAREAVMPGEPALDKLADCFGHDIINRDGTLNRRKLGQLAFSNQNDTEKLNKILHGQISDRIDDKISSQVQNMINSHNSSPTENSLDSIAFISAPLFFEAELEKKCDEIWVVTADKEVRINRTMERDGLSRTEVIDRINRQMSDEERIQKSDHVLINNGNKDELLRKVDKLLLNGNSPT